MQMYFYNSMDSLQIIVQALSPLAKRLRSRSVFSLAAVCLICCPTLTLTSDDLRNVAIGKPAMMDSLYEADQNVAKAEHCVDGDSTKTDLWQYSCSHGGETNDFPKWWIVDLLREYEIREVWITNRDSYEGRLRNFTIDAFKEHPNVMAGWPEIWGQVCAYQPPDATFPPKSGTKPYECSQPIRARYLRVVKYGYFALVMCEVQVFAKDLQREFYATRHTNVKANSAPYETLPEVRSYVHCATLCSLDDHRCNAFTWKEAVKECGLHKLSPYWSPFGFNFVPEVGTDLTMNFEIGP